jgi:hypothetical protein
VKNEKGVDDFLLKLLPLSMRSKELGKMAEISGLNGVLVTSTKMSQYPNSCGAKDELD